MSVAQATNLAVHRPSPRRRFPISKGHKPVIQKPIKRPLARNSELYLSRLNASLADAQEAALPRVRERSLRAAAAWKEMYEKARLFEQRSSR